jgi:hypothetical protein
MMWRNPTLVIEIKGMITIKVFILNLPNIYIFALLSKKVCIWSYCSYADTLIFAAAPEDINLPEPYQYNMDPPNRDERFFGFNNPSFV